MLRRGRRVWPLLVLVALTASRRWLDVVRVRGRSMAPALLPGDRLLAVRLGRSPRPGDVVLAPDPREPSRELVKRVASVDRTGVMLRGDNAAFSTDTRAFGAVPASSVRWRVAWRYWPPERAGRIPDRVPLELVDEGGEAACAFPETLVAGE